MAFLEHVEQRFDRTVSVLGFNEVAAQVLESLVRLDLEGPDVADLHGRQGIISWRRMVERLAGKGHSAADIETGLVAAADWGVLQIVGRGASDPRLTGTSALRLTHAGRVCLGLAPHGDPPPRELAEAQSWTVVHHANREGTILAARAVAGDQALQPIIATGDRSQLSTLCGAVAVDLVMRGAAVVDGFAMNEPDRNRDLGDLVWRTRTARGPRFLCLPDPKSVRGAAIRTSATLLWCEPVLDPRRESETSLDRRITDELIGTNPDRHVLAHVCGVPHSSMSAPKNVNIQWADIIVPDAVRTQIDQAMMHAAFRLDTLPTREGFVGKGAGYRLLLSGLPGTGKSLAAEALATRLNRSVVKLDLSTVLSKWLGETEQMIGQIFDLAEASNSVLLLDEAEALFRQRNSGGGGGSALLTAVAYLLTRLDRFEGVLVATTNRTQDIDDAMYRRFDDYIILPVPDRTTRERLWRSMLVKGLALASDFKDFDFEHLAQHFVITGGLIRGAAIRGAAWADQRNEVLSMPHVLASLARELEKSDHPTSAVLMQPHRRAVSELLNDDRYTAEP